MHRHSLRRVGTMALAGFVILGSAAVVLSGRGLDPGGRTAKREQLVDQRRDVARAASYRRRLPPSTDVAGSPVH